jgi:hypothetical protein
MSGVYRDDLHCRVTVLTYDFCSRIGKLHIDVRDCCDARRLLKLFHDIDPDVAQVNVLAGCARGRRDRAYVWMHGRWLAYDGYGLSYGAANR